MPQKLTRAVIGLLGYYGVSLILSPAIKAWAPGFAGTTLACFLQMFFVSFLFPLCAKAIEQRHTRRAIDAAAQIHDERKSKK